MRSARRLQLLRPREINPALATVDRPPQLVAGGPEVVGVVRVDINMREVEGARRDVGIVRDESPRIACVVGSIKARLCGGIDEVPSVCCVIWRSISSFTSVCFSCSESCSSEFAKGIAARSTWHQTPINVLPMVNIFVKYRGFRLRLGTSAATNGAASRGYASFSTEESCSMIACCIRTEHLAASWLG